MAITRRQALAGGLGAATVGALGLTAGCASRESAGRPPAPSPGVATTSSAAAAASIPEAQPLRIAQTASERARSLASVKLLDDHPLYEMSWWGQRPDVVSAAGAGGESSTTAERSPFGCTLFAAFGDARQPLVARNFDWEVSPALVVHSHPTGGFRSTAITDLSYYGFGPGTADRLKDAKQRGHLERAPSLAFDGVNEHGLFIGLAADEGAVASTTPGRPSVGGVGIQRLVLDRCRTVADAKTLVASYNLDFSDGPSLHYLVADRSGAGTVIEFDDGTLRFHDRPAAEPWLVLENFNLAQTPERSGFSRWQGCTERLRRTKGKIGVEGALDTLREVKQGHTQWSAVYDLATGAAWVYASQQRNRVHHIPMSR